MDPHEFHRQSRLQNISLFLSPCPLVPNKNLKIKKNCNCQDYIENHGSIFMGFLRQQNIRSLFGAIG